MDKLVIDRNVWLRGESNSMLLRTDDNKRCCIGIYLGACGVTDDALDHTLTAIGLLTEDETLPKQAAWLEDDDIGNAFYVTNDSMELSSNNREEILKGLFKTQGIEVTFIN